MDVCWSKCCRVQSFYMKLDILRITALLTFNFSGFRKNVEPLLVKRVRQKTLTRAQTHAKEHVQPQAKSSVELQGDASDSNSSFRFPTLVRFRSLRLVGSMLWFVPFEQWLNT